MINFSSLKTGDEEFTENLTRKISLDNVLHFTRHLDLDLDTHTKHVGIPIEIAVDEGIIDTAFHVTTKLPRRAIELGAVAIGSYTFFHYLSNNLTDYLPNPNNSNFSTQNIMKCAVGLAITMVSIYDFITVIDIPSNKLITQAFSYTQSRIKSGKNPLEAGKIWKVFGSRA